LGNEKTTERTMPAMLSKPLLICLCTSLFLAACDSRSGPGPDIHDSKYAALGADGEQLEVGETGPCVLDQFTGLIWEVKADTPGLHDRNSTYTWFNPEEDSSGELDYRGMPDGGECDGSGCDTFALVQAVNEAGYCGYNDWRLPTRDELGSISDPRKTLTPPSINTTYFPNTQDGEYWSGSSGLCGAKQCTSNGLRTEAVPGTVKR
jgi:hypothetical protein